MRKLTYILFLTSVSLLAVACSKSETPTPDAAKIVLVTGATGTQGGAVARELVDRGYAVRGLTRNPDSERATALTELGIEVVKGDFDDAASLNVAMEGVYGVFAVTNYWEHGFDREVAHGKQLVDAAEKAGIKHFVFTSVAGADAGTGLPHFESRPRSRFIWWTRDSTTRSCGQWSFSTTCATCATKLCLAASSTRATPAKATNG